MKTVHLYALGIVFICIALGVTLMRSISSSNLASPIPDALLTAEPTVPDAVISQPSRDEINIQLKQHIADSLSARTPADLLDSMPDKITFTRHGTQCCGIITKEQAVPQFALFRNAELPWNFESTIAAQLISADPKTFDDKVIGVAANGFIVAFGITSTDLIDEIDIVEDYRSITQ